MAHAVGVASFCSAPVLRPPLCDMMGIAVRRDGMEANCARALRLVVVVIGWPYLQVFK